jgi:hypothetical protein
MIVKTKQLLCAGSILSLVASFLWASNPETDRSSANFDNKETGALQHTKDGANRALNSVDSGVHKAGRRVKRGARRAKQKTNNGLNKVDDTVHDR